MLDSIQPSTFHQKPQPSTAEEKTGSLKGRSFRAFRSALSSCYLFFVTLLKPFANLFSRGNKEEQLDKKKIAIIEGTGKETTAAILFSKMNPSQEKAEESLMAKQIEEAEKRDQQVERGLVYFLRLKGEGTIGVASSQSAHLKNLLEDPSYNFKTLFSEEQFNSFLNEVQTFRNFLNEKKATFKVTLDKETKPLSYEDFKKHIAEVFKLSQAFSLKIKELLHLLPEEAAERKVFRNVANAFVTMMNNQQKIYKTPSSHPYLKVLQQDKQKSSAELQALKSQQLAKNSLI